MQLQSNDSIAKEKKGKRSSQIAQKKAGKKKSASYVQHRIKKTKTPISHNNELSAIKQDIERAKKKVGLLERQEKSAQKKLIEAEEQKLIVQKKVGKLEGEVDKLKDTLETILKTESSLKEKLSTIQLSYSRIAKKYLSLVHKHAPDIQISQDLLPGAIGNEESGIISRLPSYMKQMHKKMSKQILQIQQLQGLLSAQQQLIAQNSNQQERILKEKEYEQNRIQKLVVNQRMELEQVRNNKELVLKEIEKKEKSAKQISGLISGLIQKEQSRKQKEVNEKVKEVEAKPAKESSKIHDAKLLSQQQNSRNASTEISRKSDAKILPSQSIQKEQMRTDNTGVNSAIGNMANFTGSFRWPSSGKKILRGFGQYKNSVTNTVMENPGLDIACSIGSSAYCSAPGTVSLVHWLPGYNSMVIVDHGNSYRSVYANLASTSVRKGQTISAGSIIGSTTQSVDGEFLHFEIWKGKQRLNPLTYIR